MKIADSVMSLDTHQPSSVQGWLGQELESRGIDPVVYTRYIISLLLQEHVDPLESVSFDLGSLWLTSSKSDSPYSRKSRHRKTDRKKYMSDEDRNKIAAVECLRSITDGESDIEKLVDELCSRLHQVKQQHVMRNCHETCQSPTLKSQSTHRNEDQNANHRYFAEFPALNGGNPKPCVSPTVQEAMEIWHKNPITHTVQNFDPIPHTTEHINVVETPRKTELVRPFGEHRIESFSVNRLNTAEFGVYENLQGFEFLYGISKGNADNEVDKSYVNPKDEKLEHHAKQHPETKKGQRISTAARIAASLDSKLCDKASVKTAYDEHNSSKNGFFHIGGGDCKGEVSISLDISDIWRRNPSPCYIEQAGWYTEPVESFPVADSGQERLYKRRSLSDSRESSPYVDNEQDSDLIFGMPQISDDKNDSVYDAEQTEPDCLALYSHYDADKASEVDDKWNFGELGEDEQDNYIHLVAEEMVNSVFDEVGLPNYDTSSNNSKLLASNYESIMESVNKENSESYYDPTSGDIDGSLAIFYNSDSDDLLYDYMTNCYNALNTYAIPDCGQASVHDNVLPQNCANLFNGCASLWQNDSSSDLYTFQQQDGTATMMQEDGYIWNPQDTDFIPLDKNTLITSEHTAFDDVVQSKINKQILPRTSSDFFALEPRQNLADVNTSEHLYFSPKTHFCPIKAAEATESKSAGQQSAPDLFGGYSPTVSPYQEYRDSPQDTSFIPKFRVQKSLGKFVQTGNSLESNSPPVEDRNENCIFTDDKLDDKIDYVIAILDEDPGPEVDTRVSFPPSLTFASDVNVAGRDLRSLWVSTDDTNEKDCRNTEPINSGNIWSSGYDDDTMFLFGNYDDINANDAGYFSEPLELEEPTVSQEAQHTPQSEQAFSWKLFEHQFPVPSDALYSSDLEQIWLQARNCSAASQPISLNDSYSNISSKPCTYYMEGKCYRRECKFSHDLATIKCRYWLEGDCFKGKQCPFSHDVTCNTENEMSSLDTTILASPNKKTSPVPVHQSYRKQTPRKFYMFRRNLSQHNPPAMKSKGDKLPEKPTSTA